MQSKELDWVRTAKKNAASTDNEGKFERSRKEVTVKWYMGQPGTSDAEGEKYLRKRRARFS